jgi:hypothetical protein
LSSLEGKGGEGTHRGSPAASCGGGPGAHAGRRSPLRSGVTGERTELLPIHQHHIAGPIGPTAAVAMLGRACTIPNYKTFFWAL